MLSSKKQIALQCLLDGNTVLESAEVSQVTERTIYRWLSEDEFRGELSKYRGLALDGVFIQLVSLGDRAVRALADVLDKPEARGSNTKRLAAVSVLELLLKFEERREVRAQLERLAQTLGIDL